MKEIGIFEVHCHVKYLYTLCKICKTKDTNVTIFTNKKILSQLKEYLKDLENYEIVLQKENESTNSFLKRIEKICNEKIDLLFINTFQLSCYYLPKYFSFNPNCKKIITIHTVNGWLKPRPYFNPRKIVHSIDTNLSSFIGKNFILPRFDGINVIYAPIKDYVEKKTDYDKEIYTLPFCLYEGEKSKNEKNKRLQIVVPGQIEEHRRDYEILMDAFETILKKYNKKIDIYLLGYPVGIYGNKIINKCIKLKEQGYNIHFYTDFVPENEYEEIMKKSDILVLSIRIKTRGMGLITEYYGITKGSAAVFEGIQYGKPMIVPKNFNLVKQLESSTLRFLDSNNLGEVLSDLIENKEKIYDLKEKAYKNSSFYSLKNLQLYFTEEILSKIDKK